MILTYLQLDKNVFSTQETGQPAEMHLKYRSSLQWLSNHNQNTFIYSFENKSLRAGGSIEGLKNRTTFGAVRGKNKADHRL